MLFIFDIDKKKVVSSAGNSDLMSDCEGKRGDGEEIAIQVIQDGTPVELDPAAELKFVAKSEGQYDPDPLVATDDFVYDETSQLYRAEISWITDVLNNLFGVQSDPVTITGGVAATNLITAAGHNLIAGVIVYFPTLTGGLGLESGTTSDVQRYYVISDGLTADDFKVSLTSGGAAVDFTSTITAGSVAVDPVDIPTVELSVELAWRVDGTAKWKRSENDITLTLRNNYLRDDDGAAALTAQNAADAFVEARAVLYDRVQALSAPEYGQALDNLGVSAFIQTLLDDADASAALTTLGFSTFFKTLVDDADASAALTTLGVSTFFKTLLDDTTAAAVMTTLGITANGQSLITAANYAAMLTLLSGAGLGANTFTADQIINTVRVGLGTASIATNIVVGATIPATTSGNLNVAVGFNALDALTSGVSNVVVGNSSGIGITVGQGNTIFGHGSGGTLTNGLRNTIIGPQALMYAASGADYNTAIGDLAGTYQNDGSTNLALTGDGNTYLGASARGNSNSENNAIVIGYQALGQGSNKTVIGKAATTANYIFGAPSGGGNIGVRLTSNFTTTLATNTDTALAITAAANEVWMLDVQMTVVVPAANMKLQVTAPSGATVEGWIVSTNTTLVSSNRVSAINTLSAVVGPSAATSSVTVRVTVVNSSTPGTIAIGCASTTGGQTTTINAGSWLKAQLVQ